MSGNPIDSIRREEIRLEMLKAAHSLISECKNMWKNKLPLEKNNLNTTYKNLKSLEDKLLDLQDKVEKLDLVSTPLSIDQRINYTNSLISIIRKYKNNISKERKTSSYYKRLKRSTDLYLADVFSVNVGGNDLATGVIIAEQVRNKEINLEELKKNALEDVKSYNEYLVMKKRIPDKSPLNIAKLTWDTLFIMKPVECEDENELYIKLINGNYHSWKTIYERKPLILDYIKNFRREFYKTQKEKWGKELGRKIIKYKGWYNSLCYPELLASVSTPEVRIKLINSSSETEKERLSYIS